MKSWKSVNNLLSFQLNVFSLLNQIIFQNYANSIPNLIPMINPIRKLNISNQRNDKDKGNKQFSLVETTGRVTRLKFDRSRSTPWRGIKYS